MRAQSAKPAVQLIQNQRQIHSAMPKITRIQSGFTHSTTTRVQSAKMNFEITPHEVIFTDIIPGVKYEKWVTIRNLTKMSCRIRVSQPKTNKFRVDYDMQQGIAAGLSMKILVMFHCNTVDDYKDAISITSDEFQGELLLQALKSCALIKFPAFLDFGFVQQGNEHIKQLMITNAGQSMGKVQIKSEVPNIKVNPNLLTAEVGITYPVSVIYKANDMGNFRATIDILCDGQTQKLDIAATSVDYTRMLLDTKDSQVNVIDFGEFYVGKQRTIKFKYVNNSPIGYQFKILARKGIISPSEEAINLQSPNEVGVEQCERVIVIKPCVGYIQAYQTVELEMTCQCSLTLKEQLQARSCCYSDKVPDIKEHKYSIIITQPDEDLVIHAFAKQIIPMVRMSKQSLQFGDCAVNDSRDILFNLQNLHPYPVDVLFSKISCFFFKPEKVTIPALATSAVQSVFMPKNVGKYNQVIEMVLNDFMHIPIKATGEASVIEKKRPQTRGPEARPEHFQVDPKFIDTEKIQYINKRNADLQELNIKSKGVGAYFMDSERTDKNNVEDIQQLEQIGQLKSVVKQSNNFLVDQRNTRLEKKRQVILSQRVELIKKAQEEITDIPKDYVFELGLDQQGTVGDMDLAIKKDTLYVVKPIEQYEPIKRQEEQIVIFKADPNAEIKKIFPSKPQTHKQARDIHLELTAEDLKKIYAGPIKIDFGTIYVNVTMYKTFSIKSELRNSINCRMVVEKEELKSTFQEAQIIDSGQTGLFKVGLCAQGLGQFRSQLKYILNEKHPFEILIMANAETVKLELSRAQVRFQFLEDSLSMSISESIKVTNNGVGEARFHFLQSQESKFDVTPMEGAIGPNASVNVTITYFPHRIMKDPADPESDNIFKSQNPTRQDDEKLILKVKDGQDQTIKLIGLVNDIKCTTKNTIDLGEVPVCQLRTSVFQIKNTSRNNAVYRILEPPDGITITPSQGRIAPDDNKEFTLKYISQQSFTSTEPILFQLRSGRVLRIPCSVKCVIPDIYIVEQELDFGEVTTLGNQTPQPLTLKNRSNVECSLIIDLRSDTLNPQNNEGVGCLLMKQSQDLLKSFVEEGTSEEEEPQTSRDKQNKKLILKVQPGATVSFDLHFYPRELKVYKFIFPIAIENFGLIDGIRRMVTCRACQPKFVIQPKHVEFGRKVILSPAEKNKAAIEEILLSNPEYEPQSFRITIDDDKIFQLIPLAGRVDGGQTLRVKAMFNPRYDGNYSKQVKVYLGNDTKPYMVLTLSGTSVKPSIQFDRRELLLTPVPLGIESRTIIRIFNDGFENQKLAIKSIPGFTMDFLDGNTVGMTKKSLEVLIKYTSAVPISITAQLEIVDETQHTYGITVSGTADNCTFTTFAYMENKDKYEITAEGRGPAKLIEVTEEDSEHSVSVKKVTFQSSVIPTQNSTIAQLKERCSHFNSWFNLYIGKMAEFPGSVIQNHGTQIVELIQFLSGKVLNKVNLEGIKQKSQIVNTVHTFLKELCMALKVDGALLNQIRPIYLLSYDDYQVQLKSIEQEFIHPQYQKLSSEQFEYNQLNSYISLVYQIFRIYYLPRVTLKSMRQLIASINEYPSSNLYSPQESLMLRWVEQQAQQYWKDQKVVRIRSVEDLQDGQIFGALLLQYIGQGAQKYLQTLGQLQTQEQDPLHNMAILHKALEDIGITTELTLKQMQILQYPQMTMLLLTLWTQLPNYQAKQQLKFDCVLGSVIVKQIQLSNNTKEVMCYWVKLEGSQDFSITEDSVRIEPGAKVSYSVKFTSRVSDQQTAILTFSNRRESRSLASAIVYECVGQVTGRVSQKIWTITGTLYELKEFQIQVVNTFTTAEFGSFTISIVPQKIPLQIEAQKKKKKALSMAEKKKEAEQDAKEKQRLERLQNMEPYPAFYCKQEMLKFKRGSTYNLSLQFLPLQFHQQKCLLVFQDPSVGEFQYELIGNVDPPEITMEVRPEMQVFIDSKVEFSYHIPFVNTLQKNALKMMDQITPKKKVSLQRQNSAGSKEIQQHIPLEDVVFSVTCEEGKGYIDVIDKQFTLVNYNNVMNSTYKSESIEGPMSVTDSNQNRLQFSMLFKTAVKDYISHFVLMNETKTDVRRMIVQCTSLPKPIKATIEMIAPAREVITQEIPIVNATERDFNLKVTLTGDQRFQIVYTGEQKRKQQKDQIIKKKTSGAVVIQFSPDWVCKAEAELQIINPLTNDVFEYTLIGIGEEPLSEAHINVRALVRVPMKQIIQVDNKLDIDVRYTVETDMINCAGLSEITIPAKGVYDYVLNINPTISGQFTGSVTFTGNGVFRWWTITIDTQTPKPAAIVDLVAPIRKAVAFDIEINNPLHQQITYEVNIEGDALSGQPFFSVLPGTSSTYELVFQPLIEGKWKGSVAFIHPKMGEVWYQLNLVGEQVAGIRVPQFKTELGKVDKHEIILENPTGKPIEATVELSNPANFYLESDTLILQPYTLNSFYIVFVPSGLQAHSGEVIIKTQEIGKWTYVCFGTGESPTPFPERTIVCKVGSSVTNQIEFRNPLKEQLNVQLLLEGTGFELLQKKNRLTIPPQTTIQIAYQFIPLEIFAYTAEIILLMSPSVKWTYPLIGQTEHDSHNLAHKIQTKCRIPLKIQIPIVLDGLKATEKVQFKIDSKLGKQLIVNLKDMVAKGEEPLLFDIIFNPMKPLRETKELTVKVASGGVWRFKLQVNALEPQVDDIIVIESQINGTQKVAFKLTNRYEDFAQFKAYFTHDSAQEFTVTPTAGMLEPFGKNGTEFQIQFKPREYGKKMDAKLIIETDQMYWSYLLKGHLPKYIPPQGHKMSDQQQKLKIQHDEDKNFVIENIKIPKLSPPKLNLVKSTTNKKK